MTNYSNFYLAIPPRKHGAFNFSSDSLNFSAGIGGNVAWEPIKITGLFALFNSSTACCTFNLFFKNQLDITNTNIK